MPLRSLSLLLLASPVVVFAQDPVGYFIRQAGDTVLIYPAPSKDGSDVSLTAETISYYERGAKKPETEKQKGIKEFHYGGRVFVNLPIASLGMDRLQEVIIRYDRYLLTSYFSRIQVLYVYDMKTMEAVVKKKEHSFGEDQDRALLSNIIRKYFGGCTEAIAAMEKGLAEEYEKETGKWSRTSPEKPRLFKYVSNYECRGE